MIEPITVTENMMYCTARIVGIDASEAPIKFGTGFFYQVPIPPTQNIPLLVTNKHVVDGASSIEFVMHTASTGAKRPDGKVSFRIPTSDWVSHPDAKVDLCATSIGPLVNAANPTPFFRTLNPSLVPSDDQLGELSAVEDILMVGYPNGLWDAANNYPLIRRGITASHPGVDFDVEGVPVTVVDMACFPGSSGSPVILHNEGAYSDKKGNVVHGRKRTMLLGVLFSGPTMQADGKIVVRNIPTATEPVAQINLMMNLGYIVKSKELAALGNAVLGKYGGAHSAT
jgi:hypothetical protein